MSDIQYKKILVGHPQRWLLDVKFEAGGMCEFVIWDQITKKPLLELSTLESIVAIRDGMTFAIKLIADAQGAKTPSSNMQNNPDAQRMSDLEQIVSLQAQEIKALKARLEEIRKLVSLTSEE